MMNFKRLIKKILLKACVYFTVITALYAFISMLINSADGEVLLNAENVALFFVFSLLLALANGILAIKSIGGGIRLVSHFLICIFAFYTCLLLPLSLNASGYLVGFVCFAILYFIIAGLVAIFKARFKKNSEKSDAYTNQYKKEF